MSGVQKPAFDIEAFLAKTNGGRSLLQYTKGKLVFSQGDPADSVFYIQKGQVNLRVVSEQGKEAIVALLDAGSFFGEGCLTHQKRRMATAVTVTKSVIMRLEKAVIARVIHEEPAFSEMFIAHLLERSIRIALQKRPVEPERMDQMISGIVRRLESMGETDIPSGTIGEIVMESLARIDKVAYVRFASVYKNFQAADDFEKFMNDLRPNTKNEA